MAWPASPARAGGLKTSLIFDGKGQLPRNNTCATTN